MILGPKFYVVLIENKSFFEKNNHNVKVKNKKDGLRKMKYIYINLKFILKVLNFASKYRPPFSHLYTLIPHSRPLAAFI